MTQQVRRQFEDDVRDIHILGPLRERLFGDHVIKH